MPYDDRRWETEDVDGSLGLDFFRDLTVWADWNSSKILLQSRARRIRAGTKARIDRWGSQQLSSCPHAGCFEVSVLQAAANGAGAIVKVHRDDAAKDLDIELVLEPVDATGKSLGKALTVASFPRAPTS